MSQTHKPAVRCYLARPMTGLPELNFPTFHAEAARLRALGYDVVNPAEINTGGASNWETAMRKDIAQLVTCDWLVVLPCYEDSRGVALEAHIARELSMPVVAAWSINEPLTLEATA